MEKKICSKCKDEKDYDQFSFKNKELNIRRSRCKDCDSEIHKEFYINSTTRKTKLKKRTLDSIKWNKEFVKRYKTLKGCQKCFNVNKYYMLDFHHLNDKKENISILIKTSGIKTIKNEIRKCIVLCANCHREVHHELNAVVT